MIRFIDFFKTTHLEYIEDDAEFDEWLGVITENIILEKAWSTSSGVQPWAKNLPAGYEKASAAQITDMVNNVIYPAVQKDYAVYNRTVQKIASQVKGGKYKPTPLKSAKSIISKISRGKKMGQLHDIIRGSIYVKTAEDLAVIHSQIKKHFKIFELDNKKIGGDKNFGYYGSHHYKIELPDGNIGEIQVMTRDLANVKSTAHKIYDDQRDKIAADPNYANSPEFKKAQKSSKDLFRRGAGKKGIRVTA